MGDGLIVEIKRGATSARVIRDGLTQLAYYLADRPDHRAILVLVSPRVSDARTQDELEQFRSILSRPLRNRIEALTVDERGDQSFRRVLPPEVVATIALESTAGEKLGRPDFSFEILKLLVRSWLHREGPVPMKTLAALAGCSHPTVARAVRELGRDIRRSSSRAVELARFPRQAWSRALVRADRSRHTVRFADRSGRARTPQALLRRLKKLDQHGVGVAGTMGSRYWYPELNLLGDPRLDLSIHCASDRMDLDFVSKIDPGLVRLESESEVPSLVVHAVRRAAPLFREAKGGLPWADPVECLLDLEDLRLSKQVRGFIDALRAEDPSI